MCSKAITKHIILMIDICLRMSIGNTTKKKIHSTQKNNVTWFDCSRIFFLSFYFKRKIIQTNRLGIIQKLS